MMMKFFVIFTMFCFFIAITSVILMVYHLAKTIEHIRPAKSLLANLTSPFSLFNSNVFDEAGNIHRKKCCIFLVIFLVTFSYISFAMRQ